MVLLSLTSLPSFQALPFHLEYGLNNEGSPRISQVRQRRHMKLDPRQDSFLAGEHGESMARAMRTLVAYGKAFSADEMIPISSAHLAGTFGIRSFSAYLHILDLLVRDGVKVRVPTTVNPRPGQKINLVNRFVFAKQNRLEDLLSAVGVTSNYSCVCYEEANVPALGDAVAWAESSAVVYANSVLGARTNRNSLLIDLCSAVTGVTPRFGYLLDANRRGRVLVKLDIKRMDASALGFLIGRKIVDLVPVIEHYPFNRIELKNMGGAMAASGAVALFHVEGVTPESPDLKSVFDNEPERTLTITQKDLDDLRSPGSEKPTSVVFGCPQMTYEEAEETAGRFIGRKVTCPTWFCMIPEAAARFERSEAGGRVRAAGVRISSFCPLAAFSVRLGNKRVLTSSGKLYYYLQGTEYGTVEDCLAGCGVMR